MAFSLLLRNLWFFERLAAIVGSKKTQLACDLNSRIITKISVEYSFFY